ncbi:hypothetical protein F4809DRAFT_647171 [Biscogniauxia mediterranea]|nr:hypothetical protein F4809DRAFT_647171 [Biscogniauxia mediterranea]
MVSPKTLLATALVAAPGLASAYIQQMTAPATAAAGSTVTVTLGTAIYIQNWDDLSIAWGLADPAWGGESADGNIYIGTQVGYTALYPDRVPDDGAGSQNSFAVDVDIPAGQAPGDYLLVAAVPYIVGASGSIAVRAFNATISVTA